MKKKIILFICGLVVLIAIIGAYSYPKFPANVFKSGSVGDINSSPRMVQVSLDLSTTTPTTPTSLATSTMYNGDGRDRIITSVEFFVTNIGSSSSNGTGNVVWNWKLSTSSGMYVASSGNYLLNTTVATATPILATGASSTPGIVGSASTNDYARVWAAGSYLNLYINGTSTGAVTGGETGWLVVNYKVAP
jgi:hypothetical protein